MNYLCDLAEQAGREILSIYRAGDSAVTHKKDDSPLTAADLRANEVILPALRRITNELIISEEDDPKKSRESIACTGIDAGEGDEYKPFWLVDPLDGTRDFISRLDTFVVCIARIENGYPMLGVIHAPVTGETWWAEKGVGAFGPRGERLLRTDQRSPLIAAGSRSMPSERMQVFYDTFAISEVQRYGSALKFCKLAEGAVDLYPRFGPTHEWDTAAGQVIAEQAGCTVKDIKTGERLRYGKPGYLNGGFMAARGDLDLITPLKKAGLIRG